MYGAAPQADRFFLHRVSQRAGGDAGGETQPRTTFKVLPASALCSRAAQLARGRVACLHAPRKCTARASSPTDTAKWARVALYFYKLGAHPCTGVQRLKWPSRRPLDGWNVQRGWRL